MTHSFALLVFGISYALSSNLVSAITHASYTGIAISSLGFIVVLLFFVLSIFLCFGKFEKQTSLERATIRVGGFASLYIAIVYCTATAICFYGYGSLLDFAQSGFEKDKAGLKSAILLGVSVLLIIFQKIVFCSPFKKKSTR